jgi:hypothetical protein
MNEEWLSDWPSGCRAILDALVDDPRFAQATGDAVFYHREVGREVRLGWPGPGSRNTILAVIRCRGDSGLLLRLNLPLEEALTESGGLFHRPPDDPNAAPNRADCDLDSVAIPGAVYDWLERARAFTRP